MPKSDRRRVTRQATDSKAISTVPAKEPGSSRELPNLSPARRMYSAYWAARNRPSAPGTTGMATLVLAAMTVVLPGGWLGI